MSNETDTTVRYRVAGHWDGEWQSTEWDESLEDVERLYGQIMDGNWSQLCIERSDGARKARSDAKWFAKSEQ